LLEIGDAPPVNLFSQTALRAVSLLKTGKRGGRPRFPRERNYDALADLDTRWQALLLDAEDYPPYKGEGGACEDED